MLPCHGDIRVHGHGWADAPWFSDPAFLNGVSPAAFAEATLRTMDAPVDERMPRSPSVTARLYGEKEDLRNLIESEFVNRHYLGQLIDLAVQHPGLPEDLVNQALTLQPKRTRPAQP
ncbi:hypothetical protein LWC34_55425 [Kibdelosporangium philippinense]|uniref:Uncharacterized protein n=1 Tax=Kibdelosporangium philippinense TaxID=211113 RepID=A0ABS8ZWE5_9PSEU|nr:hypothetical protein [Kibdelosporangium philippinense]MCE7011947.1 hypothetical protein [Kibdelosporangium philippinense]